MASFFEDIWNGFVDTLTGGTGSTEAYQEALGANSQAYNDKLADLTNEYNEQLSQAYGEYASAQSDIAGLLQQAAETALSMRKSEDEIHAEAQGEASASANNKAGIAKRAGKAAAMQTSGSKLLSAIQGAQGAVDASTEGYDTTLQQAANRISANNNADIGAYMQGQQMVADQKQKAADTALSGKVDSAKTQLQAGQNAAQTQLESQNAAAKAEQERAENERNRKNQMTQGIIQAGIQSLLK